MHPTKNSVPLYSYALMALILLLLVTTASLAAWLFAASHREVVDAIVGAYGIAAKRAALEGMLTGRRIMLMQSVLLLGVAVWVVAGVLVFRYREVVHTRLAAFLGELAGVVRGLFRQITGLGRAEKAGFLLLLAVTALTGVYYLLAFPFHIDEMFSYVFFVDKGFLVAASYYPGPNNHIFYTLVCTVFHTLGLPPEWAMRLPSLLFSLALTVLLFGGLKYYFNYAVALLTTALFTFSFNAAFYAVHGRGYMLVALLFFVALLSAVRWTETHKNTYRVVYMLASVLAFYTIPVFLFASLPLGFYLLRRVSLRRWIVTHLAVALGVVLLYSPVLLTGGHEAITSNSWVEPLRWGAFWQQWQGYMVRVNQHLWQIDRPGVYGLTLLVGVVGCFFTAKHFGKKWVWLVVWLVVMPLLLMVVLRVLPFPRIWLYLTIVQYLLVSGTVWGVLTAVRWKNSRKTLVMGILAVLVMVYGAGRTVQHLKQDQGVYAYYPAFRSCVEPLSVHKALVKEDVYNVFLRFIKIREVPYLEADAQYVAGKVYDLVIVPSEEKIPDEAGVYERICSDPYVDVYVKKP